MLALLGEWAPRQQDVALRLSHIGRFPESGVAFLGVTPTRSLIDVHTDLHVRVATLASGTVWSLYQPGVWVPHCTLAMRVPDAAVSHLLSLAHAVNLPIEAAVVEVGLVEIESERCSNDSRSLERSEWGSDLVFALFSRRGSSLTCWTPPRPNSSRSPRAGSRPRRCSPDGGRSSAARDRSWDRLSPQRARPDSQRRLTPRPRRLWHRRRRASCAPRCERACSADHRPLR